MRRMKLLIIFGVIIAFGLGLIAIGFVVRDSNAYLVRNGVSVTATVIRHEDAGEGTRAHIMRFYFNDEPFEVRSSSSSSHPPRIGSEIRLLINPNDPNDFLEPTFFNLNAHWIIFGFGGVMILVGGVLFAREFIGF
ncbi:MAG: DUF3592 domain-containing protein [Firmicutes bacterium]|nr:DUF3592 domain-containing protein [Bacillota bacterium]